MQRQEAIAARLLAHPSPGTTLHAARGTITFGKFKFDDP